MADVQKNTEKIDYRVWWIPQVGTDIPTFYKVVNTFEEGVLLVDALAEYDMYQLENKIKPDFSNCGGLQIWEDSGWEDWYTNTEFGYFDDLDEYKVALRDFNEKD